MTRFGGAAGLMVAIAAAADPAWADVIAAPQPMIRTSLDPPRVVVGQRIMLRLDILVPNYMTVPPAIPDFQIRNVVTRRLGTVNISEQHGGTTFAGMQVAFAFFPQEPGTFALSDQTVTVSYAAEPPKTTEQMLALPRIAFDADIPAAAAGLDPFVSAADLTIEQTITRSSDRLVVGSAVTRKITLKGSGLVAMALPSVAFAKPDGAAVYAAQPTSEDRVDQRTDVFSAERIDSATYLMEKAGTIVLPAIDLRWWNARDHTVARSHLDAVTLDVAGPPNDQDGNRHGRRWFDSLATLRDHWPLALAVVALFVASLWTLPRMTRAVSAKLEHRRALYRASEAAAFKLLRQAGLTGNPERVYSALLRWLERFEPLGPSRTVKALTAAAHDGELDAQIAAMEARLFGPTGAAERLRWRPRVMLRCIAAARHKMYRHNHGVPGTTPSLVGSLNPDGLVVGTLNIVRPVAR